MLINSESMKYISGIFLIFIAMFSAAFAQETPDPELQFFDEVRALIQQARLVAIPPCPDPEYCPAVADRCPAKNGSYSSRA